MKKQIFLAGVIGALLLNDPVLAQQINNNNSNQNFGFNLPTAPIPNGFDEVRAADGTTCRSSMAGNGAYLDVGGIGGQNSHTGNFDRATVYGRVVIPLGKKPGRLDCRSLYQLEIERLKHELRLAKGGGASSRPAGDEDWQKDGWNNN